MLTVAGGEGRRGEARRMYEELRGEGRRGNTEEGGERDDTFKIEILRQGGSVYTGRLEHNEKI